MPVQTLEQLAEKEASLKKLVAGQGESTDRAERRALGKKLRRVQRRRRKLAVEAARRAAKPKAESEAAPAEAAPAEAAPAETESAETESAETKEA
jgi:hypothetical protein